MSNPISPETANQQMSLSEKFHFGPRQIVWAFLLLLFGLSFLGPFLPENKTLPVKSLSVLLSDAKENQVAKVEIEENRITATYRDNKTYISRKEPNQDLWMALFSKDGLALDPKALEFVNKDTTFKEGMAGLLSAILPVAAMILLFVWISRQSKGLQNELFSFGAAKTKLFSKDLPKVSFKDVAGVDEAKKELEEIVDFLKNPDKYKALGARTPKGVLLTGPSGVGKTLMAKAVAGEAQVPFFSMAGSEFMEMLVGVGASRVRDLFANAKKAAPSIIFIDEVEAIGRARSMFGMTSHDEREQTLNQILVEMDGFLPNEKVVVLAASNRPDLLDNALTRPGRFDRKVNLELPDIEGRKAILAIHQKGKPFGLDVNWDLVAKRTVGFSGADLENLLNEAAILAAREAKKAIEMDDLDEAAIKVELGPEKKRSRLEEDKKITAYHEAGHAVVGYLSDKLDPVRKISIVSRGHAGGYTLSTAENDRSTESQKRLEQMIASILGGRAAEELIFHDFTTGASSDISRASLIARRMVIDYGMSNIGPINFSPVMDTFEWGKPFYEQIQISPEMQAKIDSEVKKLIDDGYSRAFALLKKNRQKLDLVATELLKVETLDGEEFAKMMGK